MSILKHITTCYLQGETAPNKHKSLYMKNKKGPGKKIFPIIPLFVFPCVRQKLKEKQQVFQHSLRNQFRFKLYCFSLNLVPTQPCSNLSRVLTFSVTFTSHIFYNKDSFKASFHLACVIQIFKLPAQQPGCIVSALFQCEQKLFSSCVML